MIIVQVNVSTNYTIITVIRHSRQLPRIGLFWLTLVGLDYVCMYMYIVSITKA